MANCAENYSDARCGADTDDGSTRTAGAIRHSRQVGTDRSGDSNLSGVADGGELGTGEFAGSAGDGARDDGSGRTRGVHQFSFRRGSAGEADDQGVGSERVVREVLTKKPVEASEEEMARNPRSRSAKMRAVRFNG